MGMVAWYFVLMADKERAELVKDNGDGTGTYSDGSRRYLPGNEQGKRPGSTAELPDHLRDHAITSDNAHEYLELRRQAAIGAIASELEQRGGPRGINGGLQKIAAAQFELAVDSEQGQASTRAADWLWRRGGFADGDERGQVVAIQVNIGDELLREYGDLASDVKEV